MKTLQLCFIAAIVLALALAAAPTRAEQVVWAETIDEAWQLAQEYDRPMLVFITRSNCKYCTKMKKMSWTDSSVAHEVNNRYVPVMVDAKAAGDLVQKLEVTGFPTTVVIMPDYQVVEQVKGFVPAKELKRRLTNVGTRYAAAPTNNRVR